MAVKLNELYDSIYPKYGIKLCTNSCFDKTVKWIHILEKIEFSSMLRGGELILNSGYQSDEWLRKYIDLLDLANAAGLIIALHPGQIFSQEIIDYCNDIKFPLFSATWKTSYMDIMRLVSSMIFESERRESDKIAALKRVIESPDAAQTYQVYFQEQFSGKYGCFIAILGFRSCDAETNGIQIRKIRKSLCYAIHGCVIYEEQDVLVILAPGYQKTEVKQHFKEMREKDNSMCVGIGISVYHIGDIQGSYKTADTIYKLAKAGFQNVSDYDELGIYKILSDVKEPSVYPAFVEETLGALFQYDKENQTDYVKILKIYFDNECSSKQTAEILYFHKNTMTGKLNKIKEILGYDILTNENRTKIMISFYILSMGKEYFHWQ